jgi:hypothetical protein
MESRVKKNMAGIARGYFIMGEVTQRESKVLGLGSRDIKDLRDTIKET